MGKLRAVVLAAGRGIRMGGDTPKTLLPIYEGKPLLHFILEGLKREGIDDVLVVTGHRPNEVQDFAVAQWGEDGLSFIRNARFASWGNFHSVRVAIDQSPGMDLLVVNSDVVVTRDVYRRVVATEGDLGIAVEKRFTTDEEDMRVHLEGNRVRAISKHLKKAFSHGEFIGVSLLRPRAAEAFLEIAGEAEWRSDTAVYYEDVYDRMIGRCDVRAAFIEAGHYAEVDKPQDVPVAAAVAATHTADWEQ